LSLLWFAQNGFIQLIIKRMSFSLHLVELNEIDSIRASYLLSINGIKAHELALDYRKVSPSSSPP